MMSGSWENIKQLFARAMLCRQSLHEVKKPGESILMGKFMIIIVFHFVCTMFGDKAKWRRY